MIKTLNINGVLVGELHPVVTVAEVAVEHLGSINLAMRMADEAKNSGADFVKYQLHLPEKEMIPNSINFWGGSMDQVLEKYNLSVSDHEKLFKYCESIGINYLCTPFCIEASDILDSMGVPAFKVGSGEMSNHPMIRHIASKGKPMIVSTGMATYQEVADLVDLLSKESAQFMLTNCTSVYPPKYEQINLGLIEKYRIEFGINVGHSDHTPDIYTSIAAVVMGAVLIEKHFTIDRRLRGPDYEVSLEPSEFKEMVDAIQKIKLAMGKEKIIYPEEKLTRDWAHHSIVAIKKINSGDKLTLENVAVKRPGGGIPAKYLDQVLGSTVHKEIKVNEQVVWEDIQGQ